LYGIIKKCQCNSIFNQRKQTRLAQAISNLKLNIIL